MMELVLTDVMCVTTYPTVWMGQTRLIARVRHLIMGLLQEMTVFISSVTCVTTFTVTLVFYQTDTDSVLFQNMPLDKHSMIQLMFLQLRFYDLLLLAIHLVVCKFL